MFIIHPFCASIKARDFDEDMDEDMEKDSFVSKPSKCETKSEHPCKKKERIPISWGCCTIEIKKESVENKPKEENEITGEDNEITGEVTKTSGITYIPITTKQQNHEDNNNIR